jgi:hypothetical protein
LVYVRTGGRCPAEDFLDGEADPRKVKSLKGEFHQIVTHKGAKYENYERFKPLTGAGKPLWEFKHHDHRLYCLRKPVGENGENVVIVLFNGWVKQKEGRTRKEDTEIERAQSLLAEYSTEPGGDR